MAENYFQSAHELLQKMQLPRPAITNAWLLSLTGPIIARLGVSCALTDSELRAIFITVYKLI